ncbi:ABC transporter ATP-binding protein [Paracoccus siganidrum]|uniref:ABC transporter ATP-binding protein n=1 Tax=Paracoccus siganidrum TaxID=1276757 RepID=A0A418ZTD8_9RHOB|nr:ABC transporter ATP-binding protein [Paracoccus siganidrum]RJL00122.1 ABC transporter ATP-binding protein [Paracoccus siganidrum]RMC39007.1 ABC transporter ATP-binding protein [Paracoccus siganidrum]
MFGWFERRIDPYPSDAPGMPPRTLGRFVIHYSRGALPWLVLLALGSALIALIEVALFGYLGDLVDRLADTPRDQFWQVEGGRLALMAVLLLVLLPGLNLLSSLVLHQTLMGNFPQRIRWQAHRYLLRQSIGYFQDEFAGRIAQRLMQTALAVREVAMKVMDVGTYVVVYFIGALALAASQDWRLALPFLLWAVGYGVMLWQIVPRLGRVAQAQADARSAMTGQVVDSYTNIATVKLFSHSAREEAWMHRGMDRFLRTVHAQMRLSSIQDITLNLINVALVASVAGLGLWLWSRGLVAVGAVAVAVPLALRLNNMAHWIMWEFAALFENVGTVRDGIAGLALPRQVLDAEGARPLRPGPGAVVFDHVTFRYRGMEGARPLPVLDDLSLSIAAGERVGLVGRSGAGKSTLVNLLLRFHDIESGRITIDGQDVSQVTQDSLRAAIGVVTQDSSLLHRSVRDNIAYGRPDADEGDIARALRTAEAEGFIPDLADSHGRRGLDAHVGERGVKLSGGQRQRIAIARVALKDAPILILDEATSALDSEVEAAIQSRLQALMAGKTVIAIAHRLSTIAAMDRLVVMDQGRIIEQGSHAELLAQGGLYARLWARQSGGFLAADAAE